MNKKKSADQIKEKKKLQELPPVQVEIEIETRCYEEWIDEFNSMQMDIFDDKKETLQEGMIF